MHLTILLFALCLGYAVVEGRNSNAENGNNDEEDMITIGKMLYTKADWEARKNPKEARKAMREEKYRWTNATVPYQLSTSFPTSEWLMIRRALDEWQRYTCIRFKYRDDEKNFVYISRNTGCSAFVGMRGWGQQTMTPYLCHTHHGLLELFGHTIGFETENLRPDRDNYVDIIWDNVYPDDKIYHEALSEWLINTMDVPYDYTSITHWGEKVYSKGSNYISIKAKDERYQDLLGDAVGLSFHDIHLANLMYKCNEHCPEKMCPDGGFVGKDCKCWCDSEKPYDQICECGTPGCGGNATHPKCRDVREECNLWAASGECEKKQSYMLYNCPRACGLCGENPTCKDYRSDCEYYKNRGYCTTTDREDKDWAHRYCRKTCEYC